MYLYLFLMTDRHLADQRLRWVDMWRINNPRISKNRPQTFYDVIRTLPLYTCRCQVRTQNFRFFFCVEVEVEEEYMAPRDLRSAAESRATLSYTPTHGSLTRTLNLLHKKKAARRNKKKKKKIQLVSKT